ncbi:MAG: hypothetical protein Athens071425_435, partial [Parcubacteria group bacterium Athens0714_25]
EKPGLFNEEKIRYEMGAVHDYDDYELIMKINNCTENIIRSNPILYMAINREAWFRNIAGNK